MWCIRSYNRPLQAARLMHQLRATGMTEPGILVVNGVETEEVGKGYEEIDLPNNWMRMIVKNNMGCNKPLNMIYDRYPNEPYYAAIDDDEWVETEGWDKRLVDAAGLWKISNANDGWQSKERLHSFVCVGGELVRTAGWHVLPGLFHWYGERVWEELDSWCKLRAWCEDIKTEHRHFMNGKADKDQTYDSQNPHRETDAWVFQQWWDHEAKDLALKIRRARGG